MFISMPSREYIKDGQKKYADIVFLTKEQKAELLRAVLHQMNGQAITPQQVDQSHGISDEPFADFGEQFDENSVAF
jgi:DNA-binding cell septation regulator SpoVG